MATKLIEHPFKYGQDSDSKTIILNMTHLKQTGKRALRMGVGSIYNIDSSLIKKNVLDYFEKHIESGYRIIFTHNENKVLIIYNK